MTEPAAPPACAACGARLRGRWCHVCGHDSAEKPRPRRTLKVLFNDVADNVFSYTGQLLPTLRDLVLRPGTLITAQADIIRDSYLSPIKLYLTAMAVLFLVLGWTGVSLFQLEIVRTGGPVVLEEVQTAEGRGMRIEGFEVYQRFLYPNDMIKSDPEVMAAISAAENKTTDLEVRMILSFYRQNISDPSNANAAASTWLPQVLWLLMPLHALLALPGKRRGTLIYDVLVFSVAAHAMMVLLLLAGAAWNAVGLGRLTGVGGLSAAIIPSIVWSAIAMRGFFALGWAAAWVQATLHMVAYVVFVVLPTIFLFVGIQIASFAPAGFWETILSD